MKKAQCPPGTEPLTSRSRGQCSTAALQYLGVLVFRRQQVADLREDEGPDLRHQTHPGRRRKEVGQNLKSSEDEKNIYTRNMASGW